MGSPSRIVWLDLARAVCIVLVVGYHVGHGAALELLPPERSAAGPWWRTVNELLVPLRMPLFFVVSGMLAAGAVRRPWLQVLRPRVLDYLWPYAVWSLIFAATAWVRYRPEDPWGYLADQLERSAMLGSPYWFIGVLPIFFVLFVSAGRPPGVLLAVSFTAYLAAPAVNDALVGAVPTGLAYGIFQIMDLAFWYVLGYLLRGRLLALGDGARWAGALVPVLVYAAATSGYAVLRDVNGLARPAELAASVSGIVAAVLLSALAARTGWVARLGEMVGRRTLTIYLVHPLVINALVVLVAALWARGVLTGMVPVADVLLVPVVTVLAVLAGLAVDLVLRRFGPGWLLAAPGRPSASAQQRHR